jgi:predicted Zn-ribbon and HTH transcriptional regulator
LSAPRPSKFDSVASLYAASRSPFTNRALPRIASTTPPSIPNTVPDFFCEGRTKEEEAEKCLLAPARCKKCGGGDEPVSVQAHQEPMQGVQGGEPAPKKQLQAVCVGGSICPHQRRRARCKECGGGGICPHEYQRSICKDPVPQHERRRNTSKECGHLPAPAPKDPIQGVRGASTRTSAKGPDTRSAGGRGGPLPAPAPKKQVQGVQHGSGRTDAVRARGAPRRSRSWCYRDIVPWTTHP